MRGGVQQGNASCSQQPFSAVCIYITCKNADAAKSVDRIVNGSCIQGHGDCWCEWTSVTINAKMLDANTQNSSQVSRQAWSAAATADSETTQGVAAARPCTVDLKHQRAPRSSRRLNGRLSTAASSAQPRLEPRAVSRRLRTHTRLSCSTLGQAWRACADTGVVSDQARRSPAARGRGYATAREGLQLQT